MQEIMENLNELVIKLKLKIESADKKIAATDALGKMQEATRKTQEEKEQELKDRQAKIAKVENVLIIQNKNKELERSIFKQRESLDAASNTHSAQVEKDKHEVMEIRKDVKSAQDALKAKQDQYDADIKEFEERKKKIKEDAIAEIIAKK